MSLTLSDFDYALPQTLIAQAPLPDRSASRLLEVDGPQLKDRLFSELPGLIRPGDLLVFNDTRVIHARLFGTKETGGRVEILIERLLGSHEALAQVRSSRSPKQGTWLFLEGEVNVEVVGRAGEFFHLRFPPIDLPDWLEQHGKLPLPPYIERAAEDEDETRYQTVFARDPGSVAAPTAGLHFDQEMLQSLTAHGVKLAWVTLHVGAGTFQPVRVENLSEHRMHSERYILPEETVKAIDSTHAAGGRVIAVGTTTLRTLEGTAAKHGRLVAGEGETDIFILPGFRFRVADALITNFHLPKSTLLMLVTAFAGGEIIRNAYAHAIDENYRFFSYGDAMFLTRVNNAI